MKLEQAICPRCSKEKPAALPPEALCSGCDPRGHSLSIMPACESYMVPAIFALGDSPPPCGACRQPYEAHGVLLQ